MAARMTGSRRRARGAFGPVLAFALLCIATLSRAQTPARPAPPALSDKKAADLEAKRHDFQGVQANLAQSEAQKKSIEAEIASYQNDRAKLVTALIDAKNKINESEAKIAETQSRLDTLTGSETAIRHSLESRRGVLIEVLAALQRMGRKPPPALLAEPRDVLRAIRASMLLGAVLPELRSETEALAGDLQDLVSLRESIAKEQTDLARELRARRDERARLEALIAARQQSIGMAREALAAEQAKEKALASQATSLKDLIGRMETELASARRAAEEARKADAARAKLTQAQIEAAKKRFAEARLRDPARLAPAIAFADAKGMLSLPAQGTIIKYFGAPSDFGGFEKGLSLATPANAIVSAPSDGYIAFSGPWRSYGQLLIINAGSGYYIVLAGMARVDVAVGQFVLAGEPVGNMGNGATKTAAAIAIGATQPVLYVEFRKDGEAIDPDPWWSKSEMQRVRG
jgi:murein hydrolase activator